MGMRASDARWLEREIAPFLHSVAAELGNATTFSAAGLHRAQQAAELLERVKDRATTSKHDPFDTGDFRLDWHGDTATVVWEGYPVPYIEVRSASVVEDGTEDVPQYSVLIDTAGSNRHDGFSNNDPFTLDELYGVCFLLAHGMAVAAGFTCHGPRSMPRNPHGPAVGMAPLFPSQTASQTVWIEPESVSQDDARLYAQNAEYWRERFEMADADAARLAEAIRLTREYYFDTDGTTMPAVSGWSWFDAMEAHQRRIQEPHEGAASEPIGEPSPCCCASHTEGLPDVQVCNGCPLHGAGIVQPTDDGRSAVSLRDAVHHGTPPE